MTTENNKIIAEFMSWDSNESKTVFYEPTDEVQGIDGFTLENLPFDSWNWLMEVVEKIEGLEFYPKNSTCIGFDSFGIEINKNRCDITRYGDFTHLLLQGQGKTRIEAVYNACIEFIKWYNEQNKV